MKAATVGAYLRVSTTAQDAENQLPEIERLCTARGWSLDVREETESGAKVRPILDKLCDDACRGRVQAIVVWALDRLGRDAWEILARVRRLLAANVRVVSIREPWLEQEGPARELLLFIMAWFAEQERRRLIERTNAGLAKARAAGKRLGRPTVPEEALERALALLRGGAPSRRACASTTYTVERRDKKTGKAKTVELAVSPGALRRYCAKKGLKN